MNVKNRLSKKKLLDRISRSGYNFIVGKERAILEHHKSS
jgi:hypothetical protein